jgi:hypothetical protein
MTPTILHCVKARIEVSHIKAGVLQYTNTELPYILNLASYGHHVSSLLQVLLPYLHADTKFMSQLWTQIALSAGTYILTCCKYGHASQCKGLCTRGETKVRSGEIQGQTAVQ